MPEKDISKIEKTSYSFLERIKEIFLKHIKEEFEMLEMLLENNDLLVDEIDNKISEEKIKGDINNIGIIYDLIFNNKSFKKELCRNYKSSIYYKFDNLNENFSKKILSEIYEIKHKDEISSFLEDVNKNSRNKIEKEIESDIVSNISNNKKHVNYFTYFHEEYERYYNISNLILYNISTLRNIKC